MSDSTGADVASAFSIHVIIPLLSIRRIYVVKHCLDIIMFLDERMWGDTCLGKSDQLSYAVAWRAP
jgi:hypothetical protein